MARRTGPISFAARWHLGIHSSSRSRKAIAAAARPNPFIERTSPGKPVAASHINRRQYEERALDDQEVRQLLTEIRDAQRDLLSEYRRVANEALSIQRQSFENQSRAIQQQSSAVTLATQNSRVYRVSLVVIFVLLVSVFIWAGKLFAR
jgi:cytochrome c-type biogenesis protein CcmH/NrfG